MKLFVQIPCFNEEHTLKYVINSIPKKIDGISELKIIIIDDSSTDNTIEIAKSARVNYILKNHCNLGLAQTFKRGLEACLYLGADIIVNTDGDNQYNNEDISKIIKPILENKADYVVGCRDIRRHSEFSWSKKIFQLLGSKIIQKMTGENISDATSGFRAMNRNAALQFSILNHFSYTLETLIQASRIGLKTIGIPIRNNPALRPSRLFRSIPEFILKQSMTIVSIYLFWNPYRFFFYPALISFFISLFSSSRVIYYLFFVERGFEKIKIGSAIFFSISFTFTLILIIAGLLGQVIFSLRMLMIDLRTRVRNIELQRKIKPHNLDIITIN